jgi:hypothetical protein
MSPQQRATLLNGPYPLQVDYSRSVESSLRAGRYAWVSDRITSANFPSGETGRETVTAVLVPFSPQASLEYVFHREAETGLRPATLKELLAFGEAYPEVQKSKPVIALGSSANLTETVFYPAYRKNKMMPMSTQYTRLVERVYPFLGGGLFGRKVNLEWLGDPQASSEYYACFIQSK